MKSDSRISRAVAGVAPVMLFTLLCAGEVAALTYPPVLNPDACVAGPYSYGLQVGTSVSGLEINATTSVTWSVVDAATLAPTTSCANVFNLTVPGGTTTSPVSFSGAGNSLSQCSLKVTATGGPANLPCKADFLLHVISSAGGWGDPHLTTVEGVQYDFQSAGEFTALRDSGMVIQTRQSPVPTAAVPITNAYTGITHCVAIYTAVAARVGSTRVTLQPAPGAPDPRGMLLRVNGKPVTLGEEPLILRSGADVVDGTLSRHSDGVIELTDARGTQLVVTPQYWESQQVWYLNVNVYGTSAHEGTMGKLAPGSWLPALPDGSSLGPRPESEAERYQMLYEKFADAWRVTDATSLFDYEPGTSTATFTLDEWPRNHPESCAIAGQTSVQGVTDGVAQQACAVVSDAAQRANCEFDVKMTGNTGFAKSYQITERFQPRAPGWYTPVAPKAPPPQPDCKQVPPVPGEPPWCCWPLVILSVLQLLLLVVLVVRSSNRKP